MGLDFTNGLLRLERHSRRFWGNALRLLDLRRGGALAFPNVVENQIQIVLRQGPAIVAFPFFALQLWSQIDNLRRAWRCERSSAANVSMACIPPAWRSR